MAPNQDGTSTVTAHVPANIKNALILLADERSTPYNQTSQSDLIRDALKDYLGEAEDLPEEARDLLDEDLIANAGGSEA